MTTVFVFDGINSSEFFVRETRTSRLCLAPRGYGGSSFRFFEAMQLGVAPLLIGDIDTRPFGWWLPWSECSGYAATSDDAVRFIDTVTDQELSDMGRAATALYRREFQGTRWCERVLQVLLERRFE